MFLVGLLYALFASIFTISKIGLEVSQPYFLIGSRMALAGILMLIYQFCFYRQNFQIPKESWKKILQLAFFNIYLTNAFEFFGLKYLSSSKTCFIYSLSPFLSALFSYYLFSERLSLKKWLGLALGFIGFIPILTSQTNAEGTAGQFFWISWAEIAVMGAAVSSVYGWILLKQLVKDEGCSPFMANGMSMLIGGVMALGHSGLMESWNPVPVSNYLTFSICAVLLIIISNFICYNLYGFLLKRFSATFMSFAGFTTPLFAALFGWIFLNETLSGPFYLSAVIVFFGLLLFYQEELKQEYRVSSIAVDA